MPSVFITGASSGIGRDATLRVAERGWLVFGGIRTDADAAKLEADSTGRVVPIQCDVTNEDQILQAADTILAQTGGSLTGLVNNAGIAIVGPIELVTTEDVRRQFEVSVVGATAVTRAFIPALRSEGGRIVNIGSPAGLFSPPLMGPYSMAKHALKSMTDTLRRELASSNIKVSLIEAARVDTPIWTRALDDRSAMLAAFTPEDRRIYGRSMDGLVDAALEPGGDSVSLVSDAIEHALVNRNPKTRYRIGNEATMIGLVTRLLPDRVLDRIDPFA